MNFCSLGKDISSTSQQKENIIAYSIRILGFLFQSIKKIVATPPNIREYIFPKEVANIMR